MSEKITVAAWNLKEKVGQPEHRAAVFENIKREMADRAGIVVLSDAFREIPVPVEDSIEALKTFAEGEGYDHPALTEYSDRDRRTIDGEPSATLKQHIVVLNNIGATSTIVRFKTRNAIELSFPLEGETVFATGAHFDDRSSATRVLQAREFITRKRAAEFDILAGDLNGMHWSDSRARLIRTPLIRTALHYALDKNDYAGRLIAMADGAPLQELSQANMIDADPDFTKTFYLGRVAVAQLDHILYTPAFNAEHFHAGDRDPSDHRIISVDLSL